MSSTSDGLKWFGKVVRWISTFLALYALWAGRNDNSFFLVAVIAVVIFVVGNGIGWAVQVFAERNR